LKLNGTHQLLIYADDVNMHGEGIHTTKKNTKPFLVAIGRLVWKLCALTTKYIRVVDKTTTYRYEIIILKVWKSSNIWQQF
jgi:hypothetical protein